MPTHIWACDYAHFEHVKNMGPSSCLSHVQNSVQFKPISIHEHDILNGVKWKSIKWYYIEQFIWYEQPMKVNQIVSLTFEKPIIQCAYL
jgi:hypothetical protein